MSRRRRSYLGLSVLWVCLVVLAFACGPAAPTAETTKQATANELVGEAVIGTAHLVPGEVIVGKAASAFTPPDTIQCWRIAASTPLSKETMDRQATRLGLGEPRTYGNAGVSDSKWSLEFPRNDADCFVFSERDWDRELTAKFEAGEEIPALSFEQAREKADAYLAEVGYAQGLTFHSVSAKESLEAPPRSCVLSLAVGYARGLGGRQLLGKADAVVTVAADGRIVGFTHTYQEAAPAESVKLRPVAAAVADMRAGLGQCPGRASQESLARVTVEGIEISYYGPPMPIDEKYYKPVYVFHVRMADDTTGDWLLSAFDAAG